jgi:hypothetical protein
LSCATGCMHPSRLFALSFLLPLSASRKTILKTILSPSRFANSRTIPPAYNQKLVEVTAFVAHALEDFTLFDPTCSSWPGVWLEYGGKAESETMYCCGVTADRE